MAAFLDPRTKNLKYYTDEEKQQIYKAVERQLVREKESGPEIPMVHLSFNFFFNIGQTNSDENEEESGISLDDLGADEIVGANEVDVYRGLSGIRFGADPLEAWRERYSDKVGRLIFVALKYLAIPASSAPSERVFSTGTRTVSKSRVSLRSDNAESIIFCNRNYHWA